MTAPKLFTTQLADGPKTPIVLSHPLGLDHELWSTTAQMFAGERPVLAYDHRGHGRSEVPAGPYTMTNLVADAEAVVTAWGKGPVIFIGLSMGGMVGQGLAIRRPELLRALVLAHTTGRYPEVGRSAWDDRVRKVQEGGLSSVAGLVLQRYLTESVRTRRPELVQQLREQLLHTEAAGYIASCQAIRDVDWLDDLHRVEVPTLVIAGAHDMGAPPAMAHEIQSRIAGATLEVLPDASHLGPVETPAAFEAVLRRFLDRF